MLEPQVRRREHFKPDELQELADSIKSMGLISPITVRPIEHGEFQYELVAGERRYLATKLAGLDTIEAVVRDLDDQQTIEIQLHENLKRLEIEPLDEAFSYKYLIDHAQILEGGLPRPYTVADIAAKFSRTEEIILRRLKLIELCQQGKDDLAAGKLPLAHAELIARFPEKAQETCLKTTPTTGTTRRYRTRSYNEPSKIISS
jgi:ParB family chromosome partitioning protein